MSNHTEKLFHLSQIPSFDIRIFTGGYTFVESWDHTNVNLGIWLLYWNPDTGAELEWNGKQRGMSPDQLFLIPPYTTFSTRARNPFRHFYLHFDAAPPFNRVKQGPLSFSSTYAAELLNRFQSGNGETAYALLCRLLVYEYLLRIPQKAFLPPDETVLDTRIQRAVEIMNREYATLSGNHELCRRIGMSLNNFHHLFRAGTGTTPKHYLLNQRMEAARRKLISTEKSIEEIAAETGYADRYHFSKAFKHFYACSPAAYRSRMQNRP